MEPAVTIPKYETAEDRRIAWLSLFRGPSAKGARGRGSLPPGLRGLIAADVERSFNQYNLSVEARLLEKRKQLEELLVRIFSCYPHLHYYQGFHDVCSALLLALSPEEAFHVSVFLTQNHLRELLQPEFDNIIGAMFEMMQAIVARDDPTVAAVLETYAIHPMFCLSWALTLFAHDIHRPRSILMLYDFFLANHPIVIIYALASVPLLLHSGLAHPPGHLSASGELGQWLKEGPRRVDVSQLIFMTERLIKRHPLEQLAFKGKANILNSVYGKDLPLDRRGGPSRVPWTGAVVGCLLIVPIVGAYIAQRYFLPE